MINSSDTSKRLIYQVVWSWSKFKMELKISSKWRIYNT